MDVVEAQLNQIEARFFAARPDAYKAARVPPVRPFANKDKRPRTRRKKPCPRARWGRGRGRACQAPTKPTRPHKTPRRRATRRETDHLLP